MSNKNPHFTRLMTNLQKQIKFSKIFTTLLDQEQQALIDMDMATLTTLSKQKENGVRQMTYVDEQISEAIDDILEGVKNTPKTLDEVCQTLPEPEAKKISIGSLLLKKIRLQIEEKNYINFRFTHDTLKYLGDAISLISDGVATDPIYTTHGLGKAASVAPSLISREV
jgi:flagellar biosynthesis/type III secretory pathway chaperone